MSECPKTHLPSGPKHEVFRPLGALRAPCGRTTRGFVPLLVAVRLRRMQGHALEVRPLASPAPQVAALMLSVPGQEVHRPTFSIFWSCALSAPLGISSRRPFPDRVACGPNNCIACVTAGALRALGVRNTMCVRARSYTFLGNMERRRVFRKLNRRNPRINTWHKSRKLAGRTRSKNSGKTGISR